MSHGAYRAYAAGGVSVTPAAPLPQFIAAGPGNNSLGNLACDLATNAAGDLFLLQVYSQLGTASTPAGWTPVGSVTDGVVTLYVYARNARATGGEVGSVAITMTAGSPNQGRIYSCRGVALAGFVEDVTTAAAAAEPIVGPTIAPGGASRLGWFFLGANSNSGLGAITGNTGGLWVEDVGEFTSGAGAEIQAQSAPVPVAGGSLAVPAASRVMSIAFALVPA